MPCRAERHSTLRLIPDQTSPSFFHDVRHQKGSTRNEQTVAGCIILAVSCLEKTLKKNKEKVIMNIPLFHSPPHFNIFITFVLPCSYLNMA